MSGQRLDFQNKTTLNGNGLKQEIESSVTMFEFHLTHFDKALFMYVNSHKLLVTTNNSNDTFIFFVPKFHSHKAKQNSTVTI